MRPQIIPGNIYHILSRGVDKRKLFLDEEDFMRFIHNLFEFNDAQPLPNNTYLFKTNPSGFPSPNIERQQKQRRPRILLAEMLTFCLMKNHYHLLVRARSKEWLTLFMRRLNMGYANYFNLKYKRAGALFEGRYKCIAVDNDAHFIHLPFYIHCNPLDYFAPNWRERDVKDYKKAFAYLENYRWSSFPDYIGKKNFPSVTQRDLLLKFFDGPEQYKKSMTSWLKEMDSRDISQITLE